MPADAAGVAALFSLPPSPRTTVPASIFDALAPSVVAAARHALGGDAHVVRRRPQRTPARAAATYSRRHAAKVRKGRSCCWALARQGDDRAGRAHARPRARLRAEPAASGAAVRDAAQCGRDDPRGAKQQRRRGGPRRGSRRYVAPTCATTCGGGGAHRAPRRRRRVDGGASTRTSSSSPRRPRRWGRAARAPATRASRRPTPAAASVCADAAAAMHTSGASLVRACTCSSRARGRRATREARALCAADGIVG